MKNKLLHDANHKRPCLEVPGMLGYGSDYNLLMTNETSKTN